MLTPWKESYDQSRQHIKKQRHYFPNKGLSSQSYGFSSRTIKKAGNHRNDTFKPWCWRRLLKVPWTEKRSNKSILKEVNPEYSLEGLMLKLKLQYFGHLWRANSWGKTLMLRKTEGRRRREWQRMRWLDAINNLMGMTLSKLWEREKDREAWRSAVTKSQTWLSNWKTKTICVYVYYV